MTFAFLMTAAAVLLPGPADSSVVANVGRFTISVDQLRESYDAGPAFVKRNARPMRKHLEYMINELLIALEAERHGAGSSAFVRERLRAIEEDLAVDQLYMDEVVAGVTVTEKEVDLASQKQRVNLRLRWLFTPSEAEARQMRRALEGGARFDSLYRVRREVGTSETEHFLETTQLSLETENPEFASMVVGLKNGEVSPPLKGPDGFYVVRMDEVWQNPLTTETEDATVRSQARRSLLTMKTEARASAYVRSKMKDANPVMKADGFNILRAYLAEQGLRRDTTRSWNIPDEFMTEAGPQPITTSGLFLDQTLVTFGQGSFSVREYLQWFGIRQFQLKTSTIESFNASVKRTVWKMVQDRMLSREAYERRLQTRESVRDEYDLWEAKLLYLAGRSRIIRDASAAKGGSLSSDDERNAITQAVSRLKKEVPVSIREALVKNLDAASGKERGPIDVRFYKPGGTFPRIAYPTIDEEWSIFED